MYLDIEKRPFPVIQAGRSSAKESSRNDRGSGSGLQRTSNPAAKARHQPCTYPRAQDRIAPDVVNIDSLSNISNSDRKKFEPNPHPNLPCLSHSWQTALSKVTLIRKISFDDQWGFWVPEARVVVASSKADRQVRHVHNWLRVRSIWLSGILSAQDMHPSPLRASQWREYLGASPTWEGQLQTDSKRAKFNRSVASLFKTILGSAGFATPVPTKWLGLDVAVREGEEWANLCRKIAWELGEIGFRLELSELDRRLVTMDEAAGADLLSAIFPASHQLLMVNFPTQSTGITADSLRARAPYLDALRHLVLRWPVEIPDRLRQITFTTLTSEPFLSAELELLSLYCQVFYDHSGRPPALPYMVPL